MLLRSNRNKRLPEEGANVGADPDVGDNANDQWRLGELQAPRREHPEMVTASQERVSLPIDQGLDPLEQAGPPLDSTRKKYQRWTKDMNLDVMRCFYNVSKGNDTPPRGYSKKMLSHWRVLRPDNTDVDAQRLIVQKRLIFKNNLLSAAELNTLKILCKQNQSSGPSSREDEEEMELNEIEIQLSESEEVIELRKALTEYGGTDPLLRPRIPKVYIGERTKVIMSNINNELPTYLSNESSLEEIQTVVYCASIATTRALGMVQRSHGDGRAAPLGKPKWKQRLEGDLSQIRSELTTLINFKKGVYSTRKPRKLETTLRKWKVTNEVQDKEQQLEIAIDILKQKLAVKSKKLKRYNNSVKRKTDNNLFIKNQKLFYNKLNSEEIRIVEAPTKAAVEDFWKNLWSTEVIHRNSSWLERVKRANKDLPLMNPCFVTQIDIERVIKRLHSWKCPGPDNIQNFWWKGFPTVYPFIASALNNHLRSGTNLPDFLTIGQTFLKPKSKNTKQPDQYRPITCLSTLYKILTATLAKKISKHVTSNNIISKTQGCREFSQGCKELLVIDELLTKHCKTKLRNISVAWIDYRKAFDSIPHSWLMEVLKLYKIDNSVISLIEKAMSTWRTTATIKQENINITTDRIKISRGIFQGDSLSPLLFTLAINPLSWLLEETKMGYTLKTPEEQLTISHLLYMDDLKLYAKNEAQLQSLLVTTKEFSSDIGMEFGLEKCAVLNVERGKIKNDAGEIHIPLQNLTISQLNQTEAYKYLGLSQILTLDEESIKTNLTKVYHGRLKQIVNTKLNSRNITTAINAYCVPALTYSFGVIKWSTTELENIKLKTRTTLSSAALHHSRSAIERLYLPRKEGGRGLVDLVSLHNDQVHKLRKYFHDQCPTSTLHRLLKEIDRNYTPLRLSDEHYSPQILTVQQRITSWKAKQIHGRYPHQMETCDKLLSTHYLQAGRLFPGTEALVHAIQDQVILTNNYRKYIMRDHDADDRCRFCRSHTETIQHLLSGCTFLANRDYLHRHNLSCAIIHQYLGKKYELLTHTVPYYKYNPQAVMENEIAKLYWDTTIQTDATVTANRPDIVLLCKTSQKAYFIDIAHPADHNIEATEITKRSKYLPLANDYKELYNLQKVTIIPVVVSISGLISKNLRKEFEKLELPSWIIYQIQSNVLLEACRITKKSLNF